MGGAGHTAMARRKKKKSRQATGRKPQEKATVFNPVVESAEHLKAWMKKSNKETKGYHHGEPDIEKMESTEAEIFLKAVQDVKPLASAKAVVTRYPDLSLRPPHPARNEELEAMTHLWELVHGSGDMDISFTDEYIEGSIRGFDRKLMRRLSRGEFPVQDYLDLHGLTKREAEVRVRDFLLRSYGMGLRCVLVIHGRGLNSEDHIPILKERIPIWLSRGPVRKFVLAFSTARPYDGGTGAIYILLRRKKDKPFLQAP